MGFIATDGNLYKNPKTLGERLQIVIHRQDCWLLKKINKILATTYPIKNVDNKYCSMEVNQQGLLKAFSRWGITACKSLTLEFPTKFPKIMIPHFIRGVFDGDGTVSFHYSRKLKCWRQGVRIVTASEKFARSLHTILEANGVKNSIRIEVRRTSNRHDLYSVCILADGYEPFYKYLYKKDTISLTRKKLKLKQLIKHRKQYTNGTFLCGKKALLRKKVTKAYLTKEFKIKSCRQIAKELSVYPSTIYTYLHKYNLL